MTSKDEWLYASGPIEEFLSPEDEAMGMPWARNLFAGAPGDAERQVTRVAAFKAAVPSFAALLFFSLSQKITCLTRRIASAPSMCIGKPLAGLQRDYGAHTLRHL